jgi:hypothetical protein
MAEPLENFTLPNLQRQLAQFKSTFGQLLKSKTSATKAERGSRKMLFLRSFKKRAVLGNESEEIESFVVV